MPKPPCPSLLPCSPFSLLRRSPLLGICSSNTNQSIQSLHCHPPPSVSDSHILGHYLPAQITLGTSSRQSGTAPWPRACWNYSNYPTPSKAASPASFGSSGNHNKGSYPQSFPFFLVTNPSNFPCGHQWWWLLCVNLTQPQGAQIFGQKW